jgi:hypothetical protein
MKDKLVKLLSIGPALWNSSFIRWFIALSIGYKIVLHLLQIAPDYMPEGEAYGVYRYVILRIVAATIGLLVLSGGTRFVDWITPGDWCDEITKGNMAATAAIVGTLYCLTLIICYA